MAHITKLNIFRGSGVTGAAWGTQGNSWPLGTFVGDGYPPLSDTCLVFDNLGLSTSLNAWKTHRSFLTPTNRTLHGDGDRPRICTQFTTFDAQCAAYLRQIRYKPTDVFADPSLQ